MSRNDVRVEIPRNPADLLELASKIRAQHIKDGNKSVLNGMVDDNWTDASPKLDLANTEQGKAEFHTVEMEKAYKERDKYIPDVDTTVKTTRDFLLGLYSKNPKMLATWGFTVNDAVKKAKKNAKPGA